MTKDFYDIERFLKSLKPQLPEKTGMIPKIYPDTSIRGILFDIYGTLLVSASGDIDQWKISTDNLFTALNLAGVKINGKDSSEAETILSDMLSGFQNIVKKLKEHAIQNGIPFPEPDLFQVWSELISKTNQESGISYKGSPDIQKIMFVFELLSNPIYPMPGLKELINKLNEYKIPLGLVSNAQSYTPVFLNYFLTDKVEISETVEYFDKDITVLSYKLKRMKPDTLLFEQLVPVLKQKYNLKPSQVLYVGNDMLKDIFTSQKVGFKTALFAGDTRSLRLREDNEEIKAVQPDFIFTELLQLLDVLNLQEH
ncbi:MAG: HAD family hydrolase [Bacteroidales bacterium]|nr:HAD family hydrolase [Bacteroidales bacterium]